MNTRKRDSSRTLTVSLLALVLFVYVGSYLGLSRRGYRISEGTAGFYFFEPEPTDTWRMANFGLAAFYWPLMWLEIKLGTGRGVASEPTWNLSDRGNSTAALRIGYFLS